MRFKNNGFKIFAALLIFSLLIVGCTPARRPITDQTRQDTAITPDDATPPGVVGEPDTENGIVRAPDTGNNTVRNTTPMDSNNANTPGDTTGGTRGDNDMLGRNDQGTGRTSDLITPDAGDGINGTNGTGDANNAIETRITKETERVNGVKNAVVLVNNDVAYVGVDVGTNMADEDADYVRDEIINRIHVAEPTIERVYISSNPDTLGRLRGFGNDIRGGRPITGFIDQVETLFRRTIPRT